VRYEAVAGKKRGENTLWADGRQGLCDHTDRGQSKVICDDSKE